jgi:L-amino acid N-acyltransferase YncA
VAWQGLARCRPSVAIIGGASRTGLKRVAQESDPYCSCRLVLRDGREVALRAIAATDAPAIQRAFDHLSSASRYSRFLHHKKHLDPAALARGVHPRPGQDFALVATVPRPEGVDIVGAAQYVRASPTDDLTCEFAITVAEDWRGCGLAQELLAGLLIRARFDHYEAMVGLVLAVNAPMLALAHKLGFRVEPSSEGDSVVQMLRQLESGRDGPNHPPAPRWPIAGSRSLGRLGNQGENGLPG